MCGTTHQVHTHLGSSDRQDLPTGNISIIARLFEHFHILLCANRNIQDTAIHRILQLLFQHEFEKPPTIKETIEAIAHPQCRKAACLTASN